MPELVGLAGLDGINVVIDTGGLPIEGDGPKLRLLAELADRPYLDRPAHPGAPVPDHAGTHRRR